MTVLYQLGFGTPGGFEYERETTSFKEACDWVMDHSWCGENRMRVYGTKIVDEAPGITPCIKTCPVWQW